MTQRTTPIGVKVAVTIMCLVWGSTWFVVRAGLGEMQPFGSGGLRFFLAWVLMLAVAPWIARKEGGAPPTLRLVVVMASGNFAISYGIVYWAEQTLPSGLTAVLWAVFPMMTAFVAQLQGVESRLRGLQWCGLAVGFVGVVLLFLTDVRSVGGDAVERGLVLLLSPLVSAFSTAYVKRHGAHVSAALLNRSALLLGSLMLLGASLVVEGGVSLPSTATGAFGVLYLALFGTVLTFTLYFWVLRQASTVALSLIAYVTPAIALLVGAMLGEESVTRWTLVGLTLVLFGCGLVLRRPPQDGSVKG
ncbi:MAG: EamA family transporter [Planctomycetota bacterium]|nr:EamA family transporter [Planctomycetota bacterium]